MHFWPDYPRWVFLFCSLQSTRLYMISICPITEDHQIKVVSTRFLLLKVTPFLFVMNSTLKLCNTGFFVEFSIYLFICLYQWLHSHPLLFCSLGYNLLPYLLWCFNYPQFVQYEILYAFIFFWHVLIIFNTSLLPGITRSSCIFPALIPECPSCKEL